MIQKPGESPRFIRAMNMVFNADWFALYGEKCDWNGLIKRSEHKTRALQDGRGPVLEFEALWLDGELAQATEKEEGQQQLRRCVPHAASRPTVLPQVKWRLRKPGPQIYA